MRMPSNRAQHSRTGICYGSNVTDAEWLILSPYLFQGSLIGIKTDGVASAGATAASHIVRILFVHQNAPGQFRHLAPHLAQGAGTQVVFLGEGARRSVGPIRWLGYAAPAPASAETHPYLRRAEQSVRRGQAVARACLTLQREGFEPDLVIGHPGWGETMFLRDIFPRTSILSYCELFYCSEGQDTGYVPETRIDLNGRCRIRAWNADLLTALSSMDRGLSPTRWQRDQHPGAFHDRIAVIHDGVNTSEVSPRPDARFQVPNGPSFTAGDEVLTFVARDLEPVRGFVMMMEALPELLRRRPGAHIIICGGDGVSYGRHPSNGRTWRETMLSAVPLDPARVHFVGRLARPDYLNLLRVSALHLYLTVPFVLSWSCIEALASGCLLLGSDVAPVREVVEDGVNGFLVDARNSQLLASRAADLLARRSLLVDVRAAARQRAIAEFELGRCLAQQTKLVRELVH